MRTILMLVVLIFGSLSFAQTKQEIVTKITTAAQVAGIDPDLAVAIATVESSLNPKAVGVFNEQGLFQLRPEYHPVIVGNANHNIMVGVAYLLELKTKNKAKYGDAWFVLFNTGPNRPPKNPRETAYYKKVISEVNRLKTKRYLVAR